MSDTFEEPDKMGSEKRKRSISHSQGPRYGRQRYFEPTDADRNRSRAVIGFVWAMSVEMAQIVGKMAKCAFYGIIQIAKYLLKIGKHLLRKIKDREEAQIKAFDKAIADRKADKIRKRKLVKEEIRRRRSFREW